MSRRPSSAIALSITTMKNCSVKSYHIALLIVTRTSSVIAGWIRLFIYTFTNRKIPPRPNKISLCNATNSHRPVGFNYYYYPASTTPFRSTLTEYGAGCLLVAQDRNPVLYQCGGTNTCENIHETRHTPHTTRGKSQPPKRTCTCQNR